MDSWDSYFINLSKEVARKSKDRSTKVGCIIVGPEHEIRTTGYNGFVRGADDDNEEWHTRPKKYLVTIHAEVNSVASAARCGIPLKGCTAYISLTPCAGCALVLAQAGIIRIKALTPPDNWKTATTWAEQFSVAQEILDASGVTLELLKE